MKLRKFLVPKALELRYCLHIFIVDACHSCHDRDTAVNRDVVRHNMLLGNSLTTLTFP